MPDILIRDVPAEVIEALDARARHAGLSRNEFLRRQLHSQASVVPGPPVTQADFERTARVFADLDDPEVMRGAWE